MRKSFLSEVIHSDRKFNHANEQKHSPLRVKNDVTHATQFQLHELTNKRFEVVVTSYGRNKNLDEEIKNQEKAKNSPSYRGP